MRMLAALAAVSVLVMTSAAYTHSNHPPPSDTDDYGQLVVAPGVDETYYACTACHSEMIVAQQGKTREDWAEMLDWMVEEQGMSELEDDQRKTILDYLAEHYNIGRPNFPRP